MATRSFNSAKRRIASLSRSGYDLVKFWREASEVLSEAVPHFMSPCWFTLDPSSLLVTSHYQNEIPELPAEWLAHEYYEDDFHKIADVAQSPAGISTLAEATGGDISRSKAWNLYMRPFGVDQEVLVSLRTRRGTSWGVLGLYREIGCPPFSHDELALLTGIAPYLADGARQAMLTGQSTEPDLPAPPGLVLLDSDWTIASKTNGAGLLLDELSDGDWSRAGKIPPAVMALAGKALREHHDGGVPPGVQARVRSTSGRWFLIHGDVLDRQGSCQVSVIIEPASPSRISSILMNAYELTNREQEITRLVLQGYSTEDIATRLFVSAPTVQQHLKRIFEKTGVRSRRDLTGKVFYTHYEPRLRDNERRATEGRPLRDGPFDLLQQARPSG